VADCLFCKIAKKELDSEIVAESESAVAFKDINPAAPTHVLVIPKRHIPSVAELSESDGELLAELFEMIKKVAADAGISENHRVVSNIGRGAGQSVFHLHFHVLGGRSMSWPPG
jgi:histidine triad (HIT) family protein